MLKLPLSLFFVFVSLEATAAKPKVPAKRKPVSSCMSEPFCRGGAIYNAPYGVGVNLQECYQNGGKSIRGEKKNCYNLAVTEEPTAQKPKRRSLNLGETCYEMECDCVNGLTVYSTHVCGG